MGRAKYCAPRGSSPRSLPGTVDGVLPSPFDVESGTTVRDLDAEGAAVNGGACEGVTFVDCDLSEITTAGVVFTGCTFRGVRFNASRHRTTAFVGCTFTACVFFDTTFEDCKLTGSTFERCRFELMTALGGDWSFTTLRSADLDGVRMERVRLREADLGGARCRDAMLRHLDLSAADLSGADLAGADLRGSDLGGVAGLELATTVLRGARVTIDQAVVIAESFGLDVRAD